MKKHLLSFLFAVILTSPLYAQLAGAKLIGKDASRSKLGFGVFAYYDIPLNEYGNRSLRLELLDFAYFPAKDPDLDPTKAYVSIKAGYKYIFGEAKTGFYIEPQAGYCRVVIVEADAAEATHGDGIAGALEAGYSLEVGEGGNVLNFGLKYEYDRGNKLHTLSSISARFAFSFSLFKRKDNY